MSLDKVEFVLAAAYLFPVMHQDLREGTGDDKRGLLFISISAH
tara:strand:- start:245 stop:373 length:129 start_codon:yes stop_codon:yes gene_type:complete